MHQLTMPSAATSYQPTQILESTRLLHDLLHSPKDYEQWFERYSSGLIFRLGFGKTIKNEGVVRRIMDVNHNLEKVASPGAYLVDTFPSMMYVPEFLAPWKRQLGEFHKEELGLFRELLQDVREEMEKGTAPPCWERTFIEGQEQWGLSTDHGAYVIGTLFEAGSGTTSAAMCSFLLAMVLHPTWLARLHDEVDRVVGPDRMPEFEDMPNLPTCRAVIKEVLRWHPVTAGGLPHQLIKDDVYENYFIPAGTNIHPNQWAIHREPELYPDPEAFNPERWLDPKFPTYKEPLSVYPNLQNFSAFGFGRRICPGQNIAERSLNILTARIAWGCDIRKAKGEDGAEVEVPLYDYEVSDLIHKEVRGWRLLTRVQHGFNTKPKWFPFELKPRSEEKTKIVRTALDELTRNDPLAGR